MGFLDARAWQALALSLEVALCATLLVAPPAVALGWALARTRFRGKSAVEALVALPLVLPPTAIGYLLLALLSRNGPLGAPRLGFDLHLLFTWKAAVLASAVVALPLCARSARTAFEALDPRLESMARSLGYSPWSVFWCVSVPLARRGLGAALALAFSRALGEFGATVIVAGNIPGRTQTLSLAIFEDIQLGRNDSALTLVLLSTILAFAALVLVERWSHKPQDAHA